MKIINGYIFDESCKFSKKNIFVEGEVFSSNTTDDLIIDATDKYIFYGLTDLHFHGNMGHDLCDNDDISIPEIQKYCGKHGITQIVPATLTVSKEDLTNIFKDANNHKSTDGAMLIGVHMEGPYISPNKLGAQNPDYVSTADYDEFIDYQKSSNNIIKIVSLAPEMEGAMDFIKKASKNTIISLAHTTANYDIANEAFKNGASHVTHLFNAMPPFLHREPSVVGAAFDNKHVKVELISDGVHLHPSVIRAMFQLFGDDRVILISDSMRATGLEDGSYTLGGQNVTVKGNVARLDNNAIAGSVTNLYDCVKFAVSIGIPITSALKASIVNPIKQLKLYDKFGSIEVDKYANFIIADKNLNIEQVYIKGKKQ